MFAVILNIAVFVFLFNQNFKHIEDREVFHFLQHLSQQGHEIVPMLREFWLMSLWNLKNIDWNDIHPQIFTHTKKDF